MDALPLAAGFAIGGAAGAGIAALLVGARTRAALATLAAERAAQSEARSEAGIAARAAEAALTAERDRLAALARETERDRRAADGLLAERAALTPEEARAELLDAARAEAAANLAEAEREAEARARALAADYEANAERKARAVLLETVERMAPSVAGETTAAIVELPSEDMKGRLIGREGRNIRAFETITGTDLLIDEGPESVAVSTFDPVRRETARLALLNLMVDGRIHPAKIEEHYEKAKAEIGRVVSEAGADAARRAEVLNLPAPVLETLGRLRFRTSYAQNVLEHSVETAALAAMIAAELGFDVDLARRAGLLHDVGKALGPEWEGPHAAAGAAFLKSVGVADEPLLNAVAAHHRETEPLHPESLVTIVADAVSASRPGARRESVENYTKRLTALETIAREFKGVESVFAVQAGRELRLAVKPEAVDDRGARLLADRLAKRIEAEVPNAGAVRVTVIRETRAVATTKGKGGSETSR